jgi:cytochrome c556
MQKSRLFVAVSALALSAAAFAHNMADDAADYRMGLMTVVGWNFGPLGAMVKGKQPFDAADFAKHAARIASVSDQLVEGFPKGSENGKDSAAKADIWANWDDFQSKAKDFDTQAKLLAEIAKANDEAKDKDQFKKVAETCKACHDKYKKKD